MKRLLPAMCVVIALMTIHVLLPEPLLIASKHHTVHLLPVAASGINKAMSFKNPYAQIVIEPRAFSMAPFVSKAHMPDIDMQWYDLPFYTYQTVSIAPHGLLAKTFQNPISTIF